jgi:hypothetical protein
MSPHLARSDPSNSPSPERAHLSLPWQDDREDEEDELGGETDRSDEEELTPALIKICGIAGLGGASQSSSFTSGADHLARRLVVCPSSFSPTSPSKLAIHLLSRPLIPSPSAPMPFLAILHPPRLLPTSFPPSSLVFSR